MEFKAISHLKEPICYRHLVKKFPPKNQERSQCLTRHYSSLAHVSAVTQQTQRNPKLHSLAVCRGLGHITLLLVAQRA